MGWVRTDYDFGMPVINLTLTRRVCEDLLLPMFNDVCAQLEKDRPQIIAAFVQSLVDTHTLIRGSIVVGLHYDFDCGRWVVRLVHPSFPRVDETEKVPTATLMPCSDGWEFSFA